MSTGQNTLGNPPAGGRAENVNKKTPLAVYAQWALAVLIPLAVYIGCSAGGLPVKQTVFFTLTSAALVLWALGLVALLVGLGVTLYGALLWVLEREAIAEVMRLVMRRQAPVSETPNQDAI